MKIIIVMTFLITGCVDKATPYYLKENDKFKDECAKDCAPREVDKSEYNMWTANTCLCKVISK